MKELTYEMTMKNRFGMIDFVSPSMVSPEFTLNELHMLQNGGRRSRIIYKIAQE